MVAPLVHYLAICGKQSGWIFTQQCSGKLYIVGSWKNKYKNKALHNSPSAVP